MHHLLLVLLTLAQSYPAQNKEPPQAPSKAQLHCAAPTSPTQPPQPEKIYTIAEEMPRFPGCEDIEGNTQEKKACADQKFLQYIYQQIRMPTICKDEWATLQDRVVISFVVNTQGRIQDITILKGDHYGMREEVRRVITSMNNLEPWTPAKQGGKPVSIRYLLPVRFHL